MQKRVAAIHDISCFGKCSLTVALPLLSCAGIETAVIPTAILSTHTGGFKGYTFRDLTDDILPVAKHWNTEGISVDAIYTGYLGSKQQIEIVLSAAQLIKKENSLFFVDPVMADHGKLYGGFTSDFPIEMKKLCSVADIITPNITEACFMTGIPYREGPYTKEYIEEIIAELKKITSAKIVLTGVFFDERRIGAACFENGRIDYFLSERTEGFYHGTGDVFACALLGAFLNGKDLKSSTEIAVDFTYACIIRTATEHPEMRYGVAFEQEIPTLIKLLEL